jgi:hypothetical protein
MPDDLNFADINSEFRIVTVLLTVDLKMYPTEILRVFYLFPRQIPHP